jgi:hypothetical protein
MHQQTQINTSEELNLQQHFRENLNFAVLPLFRPTHFASKSYGKSKHYKFQN